jgi:hypothetical protein
MILSRRSIPPRSPRRASSLVSLLARVEARPDRAAGEAHIGSIVRHRDAADFSMMFASIGGSAMVSLIWIKTELDSKAMEHRRCCTAMDLTEVTQQCDGR